MTLAVLLVAGVLVFLQSRFRLEPGGSQMASAIAPTGGTDPVTDLVRNAGPAADPVSASQATPAVPETSVPAPERFRPIRIVVLPARIASGDAALQAQIDAVQQAMITRFRASRYIEEVIVLGAAEYAALIPPNAGSLREDPLVYRVIASRYGNVDVAEIVGDSGDGSDWSVGYHVQSGSGMSLSGTRSSSITGNGTAPDPYAIGTEFADSLINRPDTRARESASAASGIYLDATRPDRERLNALNQLRGQPFAEDAIQAAVNIGTQSESAATRRAALRLLRDSVYAASLAEPLSYAVLSDPDPVVRREAALTLADYVTSNSARVALEHAAANDESSEVRLTARLAMMNHDEQEAFSRETLLDRSLPAEERIAPTMILERRTAFPGLSATYSAEQQQEALAYAEIVAGSDDMLVRMRGLSEISMLTMRARLSGDIDPYIVGVLIDSAASGDDSVRRQSIRMLTGMTWHDDVRATLETLLEEEPEIAAAEYVRDALTR